MISKTAATLTPADFLRIRNKLNARIIILSKQTQVRLDKAHIIAVRAAALLKGEFSAKRVVVFGSLVSPDLFHDRSDIDLAVWGIESRKYYRAVGVLQSMDPEFSIDLITFEDASNELQKSILEMGVDL